MPYTVPQNLAGLPTCAVSTGFDADGSPTGVQVTGAAGNEDGVLRAAAELQSSS